MSSSIAVLGATGVYARHLIPRLTAGGHHVRALVRRPEAAAVARACGAEIHVADIFDLPALTRALRGTDVALNLATSLPGPSGRGDFATNDRVRREGVPIWVQACRDAGTPRLLQQSVALVNAAGGSAWSDEDTIAALDEASVSGQAIAAALAMEETLKRSELDWAILRGGLFYGPGTGFDDDWFERARAGKLRLPGDGESFVSLVHVADMACATVAALARWPSRRALIISDDRPAQWREVFEYVAQLAGTAPPQPGGRMGFPSFRVSNRRAREALGWAPFHADFRSGLVR